MLTLLYSILMIFIPRTLKTFAVFRIVAGSKWAISVLVAAKVVFWAYAYLIGMVWYPRPAIIGGICVAGLCFSLFAERNYLFFSFRPVPERLVTSSWKNVSFSSVWERFYQSFSLRKSS